MRHFYFKRNHHYEDLKVYLDLSSIHFSHLNKKQSYKTDTFFSFHLIDNKKLHNQNL